MDIAWNGIDYRVKKEDAGAVSLLSIDFKKRRVDSLPCHLKWMT
jgi:hypothetical protein